MGRQKQLATQSHQDQRNDYPEKRNHKTRSSNHPGCNQGRVTIRILGVTISSNLKMDEHINRVLSSASPSLYALSTLRSKGLPADSLRLVARGPSHHSVQRHVRIPCMVGICQRTEQRQDRSAYKSYET